MEHHRKKRCRYAWFRVRFSPDCVETVSGIKEMIPVPVWFRRIPERGFPVTGKPEGVGFQRMCQVIDPGYRPNALPCHREPVEIRVPEMVPDPIVDGLANNGKDPWWGVFSKNSDRFMVPQYAVDLGQQGAIQFAWEYLPQKFTHHGVSSFYLFLQRHLSGIASHFTFTS